jgi:hypothetical protein
MSDNTRLAKRLAAAGAALFGVGIVTGVRVSIAMTDHEPAVVQHMVQSAHLNALLGGLWLVAVASTFQWLRYQTNGLRLLAIGVAIPGWANWLISLVASHLGVYGLEHTTDAGNNIIAVLLKVFVVVPSIIASVFWLWGLMGKAETR